MIVKEITCKSCLSKSQLSSYVINPYVGCEHGCKYCYAVFMKKFQNISEPWGEFVFPRTNCPDLLRLELKKKKPGDIWLSSVTDPYQPLESQYRLTRRVLETIVGSPYRPKFTFSLLTKSALFVRDLDLLKELNVEIGCSVNTLNDYAAGILEPGASPPRERIAGLEAAKELGLTTYAFLSPVLPGITDLNELFPKLSFCDYVAVELLNTKEYILNRLMPVLKEHFPDSAQSVHSLMRNPDSYFRTIKNQVAELSQKCNLEVRYLIRHDR
jgi:DNA repair photolyase